MKNSAMKATAFTHLPISDWARFEKAAVDNALDALIAETWGDCIRALDQCDSINLAYLFLTEAYRARVADEPSKDRIARFEVRIQLALKAYFKNKCMNPGKFESVGLAQLEFLLTPLDKLASNLRKPLRQLLLGGGNRVYYDCPKVVEAFIRVARRHRSEPIFRFDADVAVNEDSVKELIRHYQNLKSEDKHYFFFSGTYAAHRAAGQRTAYFLNDYSVRLHFLSKTEDGQSFQQCESERERQKALNVRLTDPTQIRFELDSAVADRFIGEMSSLGAQVMTQPISGAGLCISPMAIVQLPPFANMAKNIVWIDDSIKWSLHVKLGDLDPLTDTPSVDQARFLQDRYAGGITLKDVRWAYETYLPRLIYGCLLHAVIIDNGLWFADQKERSYSNAFRNYMRTRTRPTQGQRREWARVATIRLDQIRKVWTEPEYRDNPAGAILSDFALAELDTNVRGFREIVDDVVRNPEVDIDRLCAQFGLKPEHNAAAYVGEAVADLNRYMDLMDVWPYVIRTLDFEMRDPGPGSVHLSWLRRPGI